MTQRRDRPTARIFLIGVLVLSSSLGLSLCATASAIYVDPLLDIFVLPVHGSHHGTFNVTNTGNDEIAIEVSLVDFSLDESGNVAVLSPGAMDQYSVHSHMEVTPASFVLAPHARESIRYTVTSSEDSGPHWGGILLRQDRGDEDSSNGFVLHLETQFLFAVVQLSAFACEQEAAIRVASCAKRVISEHAAVIDLQLQFANPSACVLRAYGAFALFDDEEAPLGEARSKTFTVFPETQRMISLEIPMLGDRAGNLTLRYTIHPLVGEPYSGEMVVNLPNGGSKESRP